MLTRSRTDHDRRGRNRDVTRRGADVTEDTIPAFRNMSPEEQAASPGAGYVDPLIESTQTAAVGVNKARPLVNDATAAEFIALRSARSRPTAGRRLGRETRMSETTTAALGGSKTADNLADAAEMAKFDPGVMTKLVQGRPRRRRCWMASLKAHHRGTWSTPGGYRAHSAGHGRDAARCCAANVAAGHGEATAKQQSASARGRNHSQPRRGHGRPYRVRKP